MMTCTESTHRSPPAAFLRRVRSEEHTSELQSPDQLVCRLLPENKKPQPGGDANRRAGRLSRQFKYHPDSAGWINHYPLACFFFNDTATTEIYTLSLHDALPI